MLKIYLKPTGDFVIPASAAPIVWSVVHKKLLESLLTGVRKSDINKKKDIVYMDAVIMCNFKDAQIDCGSLTKNQIVKGLKKLISVVVDAVPDPEATDG